MEPNSRHSPSYQAGFTLVELMVGLAIGMLATVIIIQVMSVFEAQRRTTTGTADAQTNGSIALYNITRELQMAGYPLVPIADSALECTTLTFGATGKTGISPVAVTDASPSDTITIRYGTSAMGGAPSKIGAMVAQSATVGTNLGCKVNEIAIVTNGTTCAMTSVTGPTDIANPPVPSVPPNTTTITLQDSTNAIVGANLACLGTWNEITYAVNNGNLERNGVPSVAGIVNLQVQYGISAAGLLNSDPNFNYVTRWVNAKNLADWSVAVDGVSTLVDWGASLTVVNRNRIKAVRIAVVARNAKIEPGVVTAACSSIAVAGPTGVCAWDATSAAPAIASPAPTIDLSADPNWASYRYRVFETIIPLRNMVWSKDTL